jgi:hypothetical protein
MHVPMPTAAISSASALTRVVVAPIAVSIRPKAAKPLNQLGSPTAARDGDSLEPMRVGGGAIMSASLRIGEAYGLSVMKFTLVYEGELKANGSPATKQAIREKFHPQLANLWADHPGLRALLGRRYVPTSESGYWGWREVHHSIPVHEARVPPKNITVAGSIAGPHIDLCEPLIKRGISFLPLVRERTALKCALKIMFLRHDPPGRVYQGGDIDNRLKTLLDSLSVPQHEEQVIVGSTSPMHCLLEDDSLITGLDIQTHKLLAKPGATKHDVHMLIEVDVRVTDPLAYNQMFLGD